MDLYGFYNGFAKAQMGSSRLNDNRVPQRRPPNKHDFCPDGQAHFHQALRIRRLQIHLRDARRLTDAKMVERSCSVRFHYSLFLRLAPASTPCGPGALTHNDGTERHERIPQEVREGRKVPSPQDHLASFAIFL